MNVLNKIEKFKFDKKEFDFKNIFLDHFKSININKLENLHLDLPSNYLPKKMVTVENDQSQEIYNFLYEVDEGYNLKKKNNSGNFLKLYSKFVRFIKDEIFMEDLIYQQKPTIRVHFPDNKSVGGFHRDRDYEHPHEEINVWVPITDTFNSNAIWIESSYDKKDYSPQNLDYGSFIIFDSGLMHGNKVNEEKYTRLSFDFRIIPKNKWKGNSNKSSISQNLKFEINDYYSITK